MANCLDCNKEIHYSSKRCRSCAKILWCKENPEMKRKISRIAGKATSKLHPSLSSSNGRKALLIQNEFKRTHEGCSKTEYILWCNERFQKLLPIKQDDRFYKHIYNKGTTGIRMDFFIESNLCIELDDPDLHDKSKDFLRDKWLFDTYNIITLRFSNKEIQTDINTVLNKIETSLQEVKGLL